MHRETPQPGMATKTPKTTAAKKPARKEAAKRQPKGSKTAAPRGLNEMQAAFVREYLIDLNCTQAAIRAGYSPKTAYSQGQRLLKSVEIRASIDAAMEKRAVRTQISADDVLRELIGIATADTNELVEHRLCCCRFCWGDGNRYQRTPAEMERDRSEHAVAALEAQAKGTSAPPPFDEQGGNAYNATYPPNPRCPECFGEGVSRPVFKDTRLASPGARSLYAGVKVTKEGMEVKVHSKDKALELLGRHLAMWNDKIKHQGDAENPIQLLLGQLGSKSALPVVNAPPPDEDARA